MLTNDPCCLQHHCDPLIRSIREESPLELAAQYGRLETVQLLLRKHPSLLGDTVDKHSALHLASRNGHKAVVQVLIDAGFNINTKVTFQLLSVDEPPCEPLSFPHITLYRSFMLERKRFFL